MSTSSDEGASNADLAPEASNLTGRLVRFEDLQATVAAMVTPIVKQVMETHTGGTASSAAAGGGGKWNIR